MILTFPKLQRLSGLTKPSAIKAWLKREGVTYLRDRHGKPFTTLDALNRKLSKASDEGFTLEDPCGGLCEERPVLSGSTEPMDRTYPSVRWGSGSKPRTADAALRAEAAQRRRATKRLLAASRDFGNDEAGI